MSKHEILTLSNDVETFNSSEIHTYVTDVQYVFSILPVLW